MRKSKRKLYYLIDKQSNPPNQIANRYMMTKEEVIKSNRKLIEAGVPVEWMKLNIRQRTSFEENLKANINFIFPKGVE